MLNAILGPERIKITLWVSLIVAVSAGLLLYLVFKSILAPVFMGMFAWQAWQALRENRLR
jgi:hypothetical protein